MDTLATTVDKITVRPEEKTAARMKARPEGTAATTAATTEAAVKRATDLKLCDLTDWHPVELPKCLDSCVRISQKLEQLRESGYPGYVPH